jgi:thioredoxin 1
MLRNILKLSVLVTSLSILSCNSNNKDENLLSAEDFKKEISTSPDAFVLDVRTAEEFEKGHLDNAINIDWNKGADAFEAQMNNVPKDKEILIYCQGGGRSAGAVVKLEEMGFTHVKELKGGMMAWNTAFGSNTVVTNETASPDPSVMTIEQFQAKLNSDKPVLVDFNAEWCMPCNKMKPFLYDIKNNMKDEVEVVFVDVDKNPEIANLYKIEGLPTIMIYKKGVKQFHQIGYMDKDAVLKQINNYK